MAIITLNNNSLSSVTALPAGVGGKVLQVVLVESTTETAVSSPTNNQSYYSSTLTGNITPTSSSNKIVCYADTNSRMDHSASGEVGGALVFKSVTGGTTTEYKDATNAYHSGFYADFVDGSGQHRVRHVKSKTFTAGTTNQITITVGMYFYNTENAWFNDGFSTGRLFIYEVEA